MNTTTKNSKGTPQPELNKGPFAKFVNRKNALKKLTAPIVRPKSSTSTHTK